MITRSWPLKDTTAVDSRASLSVRAAAVEAEILEAEPLLQHHLLPEAVILPHQPLEEVEVEAVPLNGANAAAMVGLELPAAHLALASTTAHTTLNACKFSAPIPF